ncbi:MAG: RNA-binding S4 domain-containing protein [Gammaproteobacteria bacterium]|nr:RNA-binding S4 domain-containing protein [Gammaproteobacteria bacterium]
MSEPDSDLRLDKWLWAARFYKSRALATAAINCGKVEVNNERSKPSRSMRVGMQLRIRTGEIMFEVEVLELRSQRGPASRAQQMYQETAASTLARAQHAELHRQQAILHQDHHGRPSKKDRRAIIRFTRHRHDDT